MLLAYLQQTQVALPAWVGTVAVVTLIVIALSFATIAIGIVWGLKKSSEQLKLMGRVLAGLDDDLIPAFRSIREIAEQSKEVVGKFKEEADAIVRTSRRLRRRARQGADRVTERLQDLDALYEVVHEELEEAALDFATLVSTVRTGGGWLGKIRRFLPGRKRRR
ncbi:MAG: hypothetical protein ABI836_16095 [Gemmatimonadota bacterium]